MMDFTTRSTENAAASPRGLACYRAPAMWMIGAVLGFTLIAGIATVRLAFAGADPAVLASDDYSQWRDEMRGTGHRD